MNYSSHSHDLVARASALAGSALPDWLSACDRGAGFVESLAPEMLAS